MMSDLAVASTVVGLLGMAAGASLAAVPGFARRVIQAFPRHAWAGRVLAAVAVLWVAVLLRRMPLGWFDAYKSAIYVGAPVAFVLIIVYMDELLAPRALGGLLLLSATPLLNVAQWHPSALRLIVVVLAYGWVVAGMVLTVAPYQFRRAAGVCAGTKERCRTAGVAGCLAGAALVALGLGAY
jgi:hypothetical protein